MIKLHNAITDNLCESRGRCRMLQASGGVPTKMRLPRLTLRNCVRCTVIASTILDHERQQWALCVHLFRWKLVFEPELLVLRGGHMYSTQLLRAANTRSRNSQLCLELVALPHKAGTRAQNRTPMHHYLMKSRARGGRGGVSCTILTVFVKTC